MSLGQGEAFYLFKTINTLSYTDEQKLEAIRYVLAHHTRYKVVKEDVFDVLEWLIKYMDKEKE